MDKRQGIDGVVRALRRVNFQGSIFGQSVAIRLGLSESDIDALELLIDTGAATAGRISEAMGLTTGAVTRVIDRLEQAGYVRRTADPADRRRVVIEVVPERVATVESLLDSLGRAAAAEVERYTEEQLATINDFLSRMADLTQTEAARLRTSPEGDLRADRVRPSTPRRWAASRRATDLPLRCPGPAAAGGTPAADLYRARFDGATPQVRVRDGRVIVQYRGIPFDWRKRVGHDRPQPDDPVDDRRRRRHQPGRGGPARRRRPALRADRWLRADPARARPAARRGAGQDRRRCQDHPARAPGGDPVRLRIQGGTGSVGIDGQASARRAATSASSRAAGPPPATATRSRSSAARSRSRSSRARAEPLQR